MYATFLDFEPYIKQNNLSVMLQGNLTLLDDVVANAESEIRTYLFQHYDTDEIFIQTGIDRHPYLLRIVINISLYLLHKRIPSQITPEHIMRDYEASIDWLTLLSSGKITADLPKREIEGTTYKRMRWGSNLRQD